MEVLVSSTTEFQYQPGGGSESRELKWWSRVRRSGRRERVRALGCWGPSADWYPCGTATWPRCQSGLPCWSGNPGLGPPGAPIDRSVAIQFWELRGWPSIDRTDRVSDLFPDYTGREDVAGENPRPL